MIARVAAEGRQRHAAADHLAEHADVGREAGNRLGVDALRAAERRRESRSSPRRTPAARRAACTARGSACMNGSAGAHEVHVAGDRLDHHAGDLVAVQRERLLELREVVVFEHQRVLHHLGRHAGAGRVAEGREARAGLDQQRVGMAVVAAFELDRCLLRPVAPRARRIALIAASVPELTRRTSPSLGTSARMASASSISRSVGAPKEKPSRRRRAAPPRAPPGWPWPRIIGPQEPM